MKSTHGSEPYLLNSQRIAQVLIDPVFFRQCVAYFFLGELAHDCHCRLVGMQEPRAMGPAIAAFVRHTRKLQEADPEMLAPLREYLQAKLGYEPPGFVLYYVESNKRHELAF